MACDVKVATFEEGCDMPGEETVDLFIEYDKDVRRSIVNQEFMVHHGNDPSRYLPPLPQQERPKSSIAAAWACSNPAMRQLGNLTRRGPRKHLPGSATHRKPALINAALHRPHTAHINEVREVLTARYTSQRPSTTDGKLESAPFRKKCRPAAVNPDVLIKAKPIPELIPDEPPEPEPLVNTPAGGFRRPGRHKDSPRKGQSTSKGGNVFPNMEKKRLEDLSYLIKGNYNHLPPDIPTTVRIYLSGTKQDFQKEREVLEQEILPVLREFCEHQGVELELLDMGTSQTDKVDLKVNLYELEKCEKESLGPFYVLLLGDYGSPLCTPPEVPAADFDALLKITNELKVANKDLFHVFYKRDDNALPPKYLFQLDQMDKKEDFKIFVNLWQHLLGIAEQAGKFTADKRNKYEAKPIVEHEVSKVFELFKGKSSSSNSKTKGVYCLCFQRAFQGLSDHLEDGSVVPDFTNIYEDEDSLSVDHQAIKRLTKLKELLKHHLPEENNKIYQLPWTGQGIDWENSDQHQTYLNSFIENFIEGVKKLVLLAKEQWKIKNRNGNLYGELLEHSGTCVSHVRAFSGREKQLKSVHTYLKDHSANEKPFVIRGLSGVGKSAFMSAIAKHSKEWLSKHCVTVFRYVGITLKSSDLLQTLVSLCLQICAIYNMDGPPESHHDSINKMSTHFSNTLELVSKHHATKKPLVVLLDGIDRFNSNNRADTLFWLPRVVPRNVFLLLSVSSSSLDIMGRLEKRVGSLENFLELEDLTVSDLNGAVDHILKCSHRTLQEEQKNALLSVVESYSNPLFVRTLCLEAAKWKSDTTIHQHILPQTAGEVVLKMTRQLEDVYGVKLMQKIMCYLCLLPQGITEKELCDLMCSDQEVLQIVHEHEKHNSCLFDSISGFTRAVLTEINGYLRKSYICGRHLIQWSVDKYRETCWKKYYGAVNPFTGKNDLIDDTIRKVNNLFAGEKPLTLKIKAVNETPLDYFELKSPTMPYHLSPANSRKLKVLPQLISHVGSEVDFSKQLKDACLCYFAWLLNKLQAFHPDEILEDFAKITERDIEVDILKQFLQITKPGLKPDPNTFAMQLLGCMPFLDEDYQLVNQMLVDAQNWIEGVSDSLLLVPVFPVFPNPLDMCKAHIWGVVDILQIEESGRLGVMKNDNGYIEIWDLENNEMVFNLGIRYDRVQPNVFTNTTHVFGLNGMSLMLWEIESAAVIHNIELESLLGTFSTVSVFCHQPDFKVITIHASDEDFNQSLVLVNLETREVVHKIEEFDVKDEFFKHSALFNNDGTKMVFVMARSEVVDDKKSADFVKVKIFDLKSKRIEETVECGEKKFNRLLLKDDHLAIVSWKDCSFDVIDIDNSSRRFALSAPDSRLVIQHCGLTEDNYLVGLSSSLPNVDRKYYALWFWNVDEQTSVNLLSQTFSKDEEIPKKFIIIEDLHIAVLGSPDTTNIAIWELPNSECIHTTESHTGSLDNLVKTKDSYQIYSCSSSEEVVKLWDLYDVIRKAKEDKVHKSRNRARSIVNDVSSVRSNAEGILKRKKKRPLRKSKSVRFADDNFSVVSDDVQSTRGSEMTEDNTELVSLLNGEVKDELVELGKPSRDENVLAAQLENMVGATGISFAQDGSYLILASDRSMPTMWEMANGHVIKRLEAHDDHDLATPWAEMACSDQVVIGLTIDEDNKDDTPVKYKYQVWDLNSGEPIHSHSDLQLTCTVCAISMDRDKAVMCCVKSVKETDQQLNELVFHVVDIKQHVIVQSADYLSPSLPTVLQLMDDCSYCVTNNVHQPGEVNQGFVVYHLEVTGGEVLKPEPYEYAEGDKHREYRATANTVLPNGQLSLSTGLNGDMQIWDVTSREYEGNLFCDPSVKDTRNPSLHNHGGKRILHLVVSEDGAFLLCAGSDGGTSVWDLENEVNVFTYGGHTSEVVRVAISRDNQLILTAGNDMLVNVWKQGTVDRPLCRLFVHCVISHLHISSDNKSVALIGQKRNQPSHFMLFQLKNAPQATDT